MGERGITEYADKRLDELRVCGAVHVRICRLVDSDFAQLGDERWVISNARRIQPEWS